VLFVINIGHAQTPSGCIASWDKKDLVIDLVRLPFFLEENLKNDLVSFKNLPESIKTNTTNFFCYRESDNEFAFVHAYYYASVFIQKYNTILKELNLPTLKNIQITLIPTQESEVDDTGGWANHETNEVTIFYHRPTFDETALLHEIGHLYLENFNHTDFPLNLNLKIRFEEQLSGIKEAFADLLVVLFFDNPNLFEHTLGCADPRSVDVLIKVPNFLQTYRELLLNKQQDFYFKKNCPKSFIILEQMLSGTLPVSLDIPEPHYTSRVISQPLWLAAKQFGSPFISRLLLKNFEQYKFSYYEEFVFNILKLTTNDTKINKFLASKFHERGIQNLSDDQLNFK